MCFWKQKFNMAKPTSYCSMYHPWNPTTFQMQYHVKKNLKNMHFLLWLLALWIISLRLMTFPDSSLLLDNAQTDNRFSLPSSCALTAHGDVHMPNTMEELYYKRFPHNVITLLPPKHSFGQRFHTNVWQLHHHSHLALAPMAFITVLTRAKA